MSYIGGKAIDAVAGATDNGLVALAKRVDYASVAAITPAAGDWAPLLVDELGRLHVAIGPYDPISRIPVMLDYAHHQLHEGPTWTANGTLQTSYNRNRNSAIAPGMTIYASGGTALTVNTLGTLLTTAWVLSSKAGTDVARDLMEWDLKTSTEYLLRVTTSSNTNVLIRLNWYEDLGV